VEQLLADPDLGPGMVLLLDWRKVTGVSSIADAFEGARIAYRLTERIGPFRVAVVVARDANLGITNATEVYTRQHDGIELRGFLDIGDAEAWLRAVGAVSGGIPSRGAETQVGLHPEAMPPSTCVGPAGHGSLAT
jgi:hypothetical protein